MMDTDSFIAEGSGDNFFIVKNGEVITPEGRNCLVGISRNYIFEVCKELGIVCVEKNIEPYDVYTADEAFMTEHHFVHFRSLDLMRHVLEMVNLEI